MHGGYTQWAAWSGCSSTCGVGKKKRSRTCSNPVPRNGGKNCDGLGDPTETENCNQQQCPNQGIKDLSFEWSKLIYMSNSSRYSSHGFDPTSFIFLKNARIFSSKDLKKSIIF